MRAWLLLGPALLAGCAAPGTKRLETDLAAQPSATAVLQSHCREPIRAEVVREAVRPAPAGPLAAEMNRQLDTSDRPFGAVAAPLGFARERLASRRGRVPPCPAGTVLSQQGLLRLPSGKPLALVIECYTHAALR